MKKKTAQEQLREQEAPQLGDDLGYIEDASKMEIPVCTYMIPLRVETPDRLRNIISIFLTASNKNSWSLPLRSILELSSSPFLIIILLLSLIHI